MRPTTATRGQSELLPEFAPPPFSPLPGNELHGFEKIAVRIGEKINTSDPLKRVSTAFMHQIPRRFVTWATRYRWRMHGIEHVMELRPPRGVILVSNHLSFFDMYVASAAMFVHGNFIERLYFPVRTSFFYDNPLGAFINYLMSGYAMWPPVFRDERRSTLNPLGLLQMAHVLSRPGSVLGIHPEGTRGKGSDPYRMGPARPGVGRLVQLCHPDTLVLPFFIMGLSNDIKREVRARISKDESVPPVRMYFTAPRRCGDLLEDGAPPLQIAERMLSTITALGEEDRARHGG